MVRIVLIVVAIGFAILALEWLDLWPEWAQVDRSRPLRIPR